MSKKVKKVELLVFILSLMWGPTQAQAKLDPYVNVGVASGYDSNITLAKEEVRESFFSTFILGLGLKQESKIQKLGAEVSLRQRFFATESEFNNLSEAFRLSYALDLSEKDRFKLTNRFDHAEEPRSLEDAFGSQGGRYSYFKNSVGLAYEKDISEALISRLRYKHDDNFYNRKDILDTQLNLVGFDLDYALSSANIFLTTYEFLNRTFSNDESSQTHSWGLGLRHYLSKQLSVEGKVGANRIRVSDGEWSTTPRYRLALLNELDETMQSVLSFEKQSATNSTSAEVFDSWRLTANINKDLSDRLHGSAGSFLGQGDYEDSGATDDLWGVQLGLNYDLTKRSAVNVGYSYTSYDSSREINDYVKNLITVGWTSEF